MSSSGLPPRAVLAALLALGAAWAPGCGARTGLEGGPPEGHHECLRDSQCDDGIFCNGEERCLDGECLAGDPPCDDDDPCTEYLCSEERRECSGLPVELDDDGDGFESQLCGGPDCDDGDAEVHPGAPELCDGRDDDCDGQIDEVEPPRRLAEADLAGGTFGAALAWAEDRFFLVWHSAGEVDRPLMLGLLEPAGSFLGDPTALTEISGESFGPSLSWSGRVMVLAHHFVSSTDRRDSLSVRRFDSEGRPLDPALHLTTTGPEMRNPWTAWSGTDFGLVFRRGRFGSGSSELVFLAVGEGGELASFDRRVADGSADSYSPRLVQLGETYAAAWIDERDGEFLIRLARLGHDGEVLGEPATLARSETYCYSLNLVWAADRLFLAWTELVYPFGSRMRFVTAAPEGEVLAPPALLTPEPDDATSPAVVPSGEDLALAWVSYQGPVLPETPAMLRFAWITLEGELLGEPLSLTPPGSWSRRPVVAWSGREVGVVWLDRLEGEEAGVYYARVCAR